VKTAAALIIGNEILSGKIGDANLVVLARTLRRLGVRLVRAVTVLDELDVIVQEVRALAKAHDWVFTSGGVGPTHDDLTIDGVARAFDRDVVVSSRLDEMLRHAYGERLTDGHLRMARVPDGCKLVTSSAVPWPTVLMQNVWVLPGVPEIFEMKMQQLDDELGPGTPFVSLSVLSTLDEGHLKPFLDRVVERFPGVDIGSYPRWSDPIARTKLTFDGRDADDVTRARDAFVESLPSGALFNPA
jgi:molybdenum cofactor synthesis domain-containing protein